MPGSSAQAPLCSRPATTPTDVSSSSSPNVGSGIVGVFDPSAALEAQESRAAESAFEPWEHASVVSAGPLTAARAPAVPETGGARRLPPPPARRRSNLARAPPAPAGGARL